MVPVTRITQKTNTEKNLEYSLKYLTENVINKTYVNSSEAWPIASKWEMFNEWDIQSVLSKNAIIIRVI